MATEAHGNVPVVIPQASSPAKLSDPPVVNVAAHDPLPSSPSHDPRVGPLPDAAEAPVAVPPAENGEAPAEIKIPSAPGKDGSMEVVLAAEVLRRVNRTRQTVSLVSQVIIRCYEEEALHAEVSRHLVTFGGYLMAWIGLAEQEGGEARRRHVVRPVAHAGLEPNFLSALKITWSNDLSNRSPTSLAIQEQRPYVARNILKEPRYAVLRRDAQLYGYTATCALPLQFAQYGLGVLTIHAMEPDAFNAEEVALLRELANDLAAGVISLRERAKRRHLEERLGAVIDAADEAIIGTDLAGTITDWNQGATRLFGYSAEEALGSPFNTLLVVPEGSQEHERVAAIILRGERVPRFEAIRKCKEGKPVRTSATISPIFGIEGKVIGSTAVEHDVTAERAAEAVRRGIEVEKEAIERLRNLETVRKTFISEASHELNTPLTPLRLQVAAMQESPELTPQLRTQMVVIERNVLRLCNLVNSMLDASRLETGRFQLNLDEVPLAAVVQDIIDGLQSTASEAGIRLRAGNVENLVATADNVRINQVLHNLVSNAIKFSSSGSSITLHVRKVREEAVVQVVDKGVGLTADQIGRLFQPFSRPHEQAASSPKGTGLGLFISKGIIEQHGGRIWADSAGPGEGSTFSFSLPLARVKTEPNRATQASNALPLPNGVPLEPGKDARPTE
ncbi:MAG TPA: ATP-binding protein [Candidatus Thermoplasmatota archaeon]|nr:ATP-binding protein [Candidatus Thermoplasmatota archaeon]